MKNTIVSISLKETDLAQMSALERRGFCGRSDVVRAAVRQLAAEFLDREPAKGVHDAVLVLKYEERIAETVQHLQHQVGSLVKTKLHNHLDQHRCMEILVLHGESKKMQELTDHYHTTKGMLLVRLITL